MRWVLQLSVFAMFGLSLFSCKKSEEKNDSAQSVAPLSASTSVPPPGVPIEPAKSSVFETLTRTQPSPKPGEDLYEVKRSPQEHRYRNYVIRLRPKTETQPLALEMEKGGKRVYALEDSESNFFYISPKIRDLNRDGTLEMVVCAYNDGNAGGSEDHILELGETVRELARLYATECIEHTESLQDIDGDGVEEIRIFDFYGNHRGGWPDGQGHEVPAPEIYFRWDAVVKRYFFDPKSLQTPVPDEAKFRALVAELRASPKWRQGRVPSELLQKSLELMYAGHEALGERLLKEARPQNTPFYPSVIAALKEFRGESPYWKAIRSGQRLYLDEIKL